MHDLAGASSLHPSHGMKPAFGALLGAPFRATLHTSLEAVAPLWRALEAEGASTPYQRLDWVRTVLAHLAGPARSTPLFVTVADQNDRVVMLVPLAIVTRQGCRVVTWLDLGVCDYAMPVLADAFEPNAAQSAAIWASLCAVLPEADLIQISRIPVRACGRLNPIAALPGCRTMAMEASSVTLAGDPDTVLDRLCRPTTIRDLRYKRRRLERFGAVRFLQATNPAEIDAIFEALVEQRRQRFGTMGRSNLLATSEARDFYRAVAHEGLRGGPARLFGLSVDGAWIATSYGLVHRGTFYYLIPTNLGGHWNASSPGLLVTAETIRWASAQGLQRYDFTVGLLPYKRKFGVETQELRELIQARTLKGAALKEILRAADVAKTWLKTTSVFGSLQKARRFMGKFGL